MAKSMQEELNTGISREVEKIIPKGEGNNIALSPTYRPLKIEKNVWEEMSV
jgi:hypothetical protein